MPMLSAAQWQVIKMLDSRPVCSTSGNRRCHHTHIERHERESRFRCVRGFRACLPLVFSTARATRELPPTPKEPTTRNQTRLVCRTPRPKANGLRGAIPAMNFRTMRHRGSMPDKRALCGGDTRREKPLVSQCAAEAPIGDTFRQKTLRYQQTARFRTIQVRPKD